VPGDFFIEFLRDELALSLFLGVGDDEKFYGWSFASLRLSLADFFVQFLGVFSLTVDTIKYRL
jgi:hypothetical protein